METIGNSTGKRSLSRRDFTKKSVLAIAALGTAGLAGYGIFNEKKLRTLNNVRRMGHCAPSVMQTLLGINGIRDKNMVLYSGGMAGGIAGPGMECGAMTAPLMFMGFQNNGLTGISEKLAAISKAQSYVKAFTDSNGSCICGRIRHGGMPECDKAICNFYKPFSDALSKPVILPDEAEESYSVLLKTFDNKKFHCSQNVLNSSGINFQVTQQLKDASWLFAGGIAMLNRTCGALAAGVMALSAETAEIENSYSRVAKMNRLLKNGDNEALDDDINNFNRAINLSDQLGIWFRKEFGSTTCFDICGLNFSRIKDAEKFISGGSMDRCNKIAEKVANKIIKMI